MWLGIALTVRSTVTEVCAEFVSRNTLTVISSFLYEYKLSFAVIIHCGTKGDYMPVKK
jgi:hypothetical protein